MAEIIDIFDGNHNLIGCFERVAAHQQGLWHQTFHCWIVAKRNERNYVVLQLRSPTKRNYPNMLDITAAGHLDSGESPEDGVRELEEELGVRVTADNLVSLGIKHDIMDEPNGVRNREFSHVYLLRDDRPLSGYHLQESEVSGLVEMEINEGLRLFSGEIRKVNCPAVRVEDGGVSDFFRDVQVEDLIPRVDQYYLKIFMLADLYLKGYPYLSI